MSAWEMSVICFVLGALISWVVAAAGHWWEMVKSDDERLFPVGPLRSRRESQLRLFCADDHKWFGEVLPAVCPCCHKPAVGARL